MSDRGEQARLVLEQLQSRIRTVNHELQDLMRVRDFVQEAIADGRTDDRDIHALLKDQRLTD